ncbi:hypothetical protein [Paraflavitalea sp. CAU 1676]|uniref:toxin-antitoxin system YwqK family antitoxin n=1 Tax=Paraflavitalea sp. CAU 1676 TaxID=3032598 RepID=UPI0023DC5252|nr:hypothetical protein [Paraflavitalea sp. CAU 1676]MDF2187778.1 hypothetical protein [Paraflavitalea sp. CAU 1676]
MKHLLTLFTLLIACYCSLAQSIVDTTYDYTGTRIIRYGKFDSAQRCWRLYELQRNGSTAAVTKLDPVNFQPLDSMTTYYPNGQIAFVLPHQLGYIWGNFVAYYPSGRVKQTGTYYRGFKSGRWVEYYPEGQLQSERFYALSQEDSTFQRPLSAEDFARSFAVVEKLVYGEPDSLKALTPSHGYYRATYEFKVLVPAKTGIWKQYNEKGRVISKFKYGRSNKTNSK